jgi:hypothetical protein
MAKKLTKTVDVFNPTFAVGSDFHLTFGFPAG